MSNDYPSRSKWLAIRDSKRFTRRTPKMKPPKQIRNIREVFGLGPRDHKPPRVMKGSGTNPHVTRSGPGRVARHKVGRVGVKIGRLLARQGL